MNVEKGDSEKTYFSALYNSMTICTGIPMYSAKMIAFSEIG